MPNPEADLEAYFAGRVKARGGTSLKIMTIGAGTPDRLVMFPVSRMFLVELKTEDGALSAIQKHEHAKLARLGHVVHVVTGEPGVDEWTRWASRQ